MPDATLLNGVKQWCACQCFDSVTSTPPMHTVHFKLSKLEYCNALRTTDSQICSNSFEIFPQLEWWPNASTWNFPEGQNTVSNCSPHSTVSYSAGINRREQDWAVGTENIPHNMDFIKPTCLHKHSSEKEVTQDPRELNIYEVWWGLSIHIWSLSCRWCISLMAPKSHWKQMSKATSLFCKCPDPSDWKEFSERIAKCGHLTWDKWMQMSFSILQAVYVWWVSLSRDKRFVLSCF